MECSSVHSIAQMLYVEGMEIGVDKRQSMTPFPRAYCSELTVWVVVSSFFLLLEAKQVLQEVRDSKPFRLLAPSLRSEPPVGMGFFSDNVFGGDCR